ncbi:uncharacterized protein METZ01_LOCUS241603, partial [marine metagenome]
MAWGVRRNRFTLLQFYAPFYKSLQAESVHFQITRVGNSCEEVDVHIV